METPIVAKKYIINLKIIKLQIVRIELFFLINYLDQILTNWYKEGLTTINDIEIFNENYKKQASSNKKSNFNKKSNSNNEQNSNNKLGSKSQHKIEQFNRMLSHNYDYDELDRLEWEYQTQKRTGNI